MSQSLPKPFEASQNRPAKTPKALQNFDRIFTRFADNRLWEYRIFSFKKACLAQTSRVVPWIFHLFLFLEALQGFVRLWQLLEGFGKFWEALEGSAGFAKFCKALGGFVGRS